MSLLPPQPDADGNCPHCRMPMVSDSDSAASRAAAPPPPPEGEDVDEINEAVALLVGAADWIMREVRHAENGLGQEQTHARNMSRAVRAQAERLLKALDVRASAPPDEGKA